MTLDEAIAHAEEVAEENRKMAVPGCDECAKEHEQLAKWLEELKRYKAQSDDKICPFRNMTDVDDDTVRNYYMECEGFKCPYYQPEYKEFTCSSFCKRVEMNYYRATHLGGQT